ncbi:hypothetical protein AEM42_06565 [Betaproteobacteria bacterium UKL13-2]|jgi:hypothetical protein|nr:hypothetical protein AEM42_06565 [Betaproteobacteria bacterium UKL13-2]HCG54062.1 hypothetical protein [Betaproteobacteria bacterium]
MTTIQADNFDWIPLTGAKPSGKRPYFFDDPAVERVLAITMAVAQEVAVIRERLDTVERLLEKNGSITRADIDTYAPDPASATERAEWQRMYIARVLRIVQQEIEAMSKPENNVDIEAQAEDLKRN